MECKMCGDCCKGAKCVVIEEELGGRLKEYKDRFYLSEIAEGTFAGLRFYRPKSQILPLGDPIYEELAKGTIKGPMIVNGPCVFLNKGLCTIHDKKPKYGSLFCCDGSGEKAFLRYIREQALNS